MTRRGAFFRTACLLAGLLLAGGPAFAVEPAGSAGLELLEPEFSLLLDPDWVLESLSDGDQEFRLVEFPFELAAQPPPDAEELPIPESTLIPDPPQIPKPPPADPEGDSAGKSTPVAAKKSKPPPKVWEVRAEFGLSGTEGNSQRFTTRYGGKIKRETPGNKLTLDLTYKTSYASSVKNEDRAWFDGRSEWPLKGSPWHAFLHNTTEYDAFTAFDLRVTADVGLGYDFIKTDNLEFQGRMGTGFSREIGGPNDEFVPEGSIGLDFEWELTSRQKLSISSDLYPDLGNFDKYRMRSKASWEIELDPEARLSLLFNIVDRFDSTPEGREKNDLDYTSLLVWKF